MTVTEVSTVNIVTTEAATTESPTTEVPTTEALTTEALTTKALTTETLTTEAPTTEAPTTEAATTEVPTTEAPSTVELTTPHVTQVTPFQNCTDTDSCEGHYTCDAATGEKVCNDGFTGADCKDRAFSGGSIDPQCPDVGNVCKHGGTCWNKTCCCLDGYVGDICETEINECESDPCQNGGTCIDEVDEYYCLCEEGTPKCCRY